MKYAYLLIHLFTIAYPLAQSFEKRIHFVDKWKYIFQSLIPTSFVFIIWDCWFTSLNVWKFNPEYLIGFYIANLPIEECMFFFVAPFSSIFIYEVLNYFVKKDILGKYATSIALLLAALSALVSVLNYAKIYPLILFGLLSLVLLIHALIIKADYLGRFFLSFMVVIIPFLIVNGLLTSLPIVIYNDEKTLGIKIINTIPLEDLFYGLLLLLINITIYEWLKRKDMAKASE